MPEQQGGRGLISSCPPCCRSSTRSPGSRRSGSTSPLGLARASPSPPAHADAALLPRKLSLGGGRPYTPSPQGEPAVSGTWGRHGVGLQWDGTRPCPLSYPAAGTIPERLAWSRAPSPQAAEMWTGRSLRPGRSPRPVCLCVLAGAAAGLGCWWGRGAELATLASGPSFVHGQVGGSVRWV